MDSYVRNSSASSAVYYCCVFDGKMKLHSYNNGFHELETLADICLDNSPPYHAWYFHTVRRRTYGFLMENGFIYFVIANSTICKSDLLMFLQYLRDGFKKSFRNEFYNDLVPVIEQLIISLEKVPRYTCMDDLMQEGSSPSEAPNMPLLGRSCSNRHDKKKINEIKMDNRDTEIDVPTTAPTGVFSLQKSLSSRHIRSQQTARILWWQLVKIVIAADILICLILFAIWLVICNGILCLKDQ